MPSANEQVSKQNKQNTHHPGAFWEKSLGLAGLLLVIGIISFLVYQALQTDQPPTVSIAVKEVVAQEHGYLVQIRVFNHGDKPAANSVVAGLLTDAAGNVHEIREITFDLLPPHSHRIGGLFFQADPDNYQLELEFHGYGAP